MKNFWKTVLAVMLGTVLLNLAGLMFFISLAGALGSSSSSVTEVPADAILNVDMSKLVIAEQTQEVDPFSALASGNTAAMEIRTVGILDAVKALEAAADDPKIKCVYLRPDMAGGIAHLEEFRAALDNFRKSGKPVYAYIQSATNAGYYLATVADRIYMSSYHGGMIQLVGLGGTLMYYKDLLDRLGVNIQLIRHGKYKSAGEPFIRSTASAENLEQQRVMISGIWSEMVAPMAARAGVSVERFNEMIDNLELVDAEAFARLGLVDELVSMGQMKEKICAMTGAAKYSDVKSISLADYIPLAVKDNFRTKDCIAIIYADGEIVDGHDVKEIAGKRFAELVSEVAADDMVRAVVLRVNSPGGSVVAASQIKEALDTLAAHKPVVASYGAYAASGGYWISACCERIFSDATTLTGSIGVFGMIPDFGGAVKKHAHINMFTVSSNKHADMYGLMRALTPEEVAYIQKDIENIYTEFTTLVAGGRKMDVARVDELGQGRVWTGRDALERGLVDEIGGLKEALEYTALQNGLATYRVVAYPRPMTMMEQIMSSLSAGEQAEKLVEGLGIPASAVHGLKMMADMKTPAVYARMPFVMDIR